MQKANSDTNDTCRTPYCLKLLHRKLLERSSRLFLKTKERSFRWHHEQEVIRIWSEVVIVEKKRKELICTSNIYSREEYYFYFRVGSREAEGGVTRNIFFFTSWWPFKNVKSELPTVARFIDIEIVEQSYAMRSPTRKTLYFFTRLSFNEKYLNGHERAYYFHSLSRLISAIVLFFLR